MILHWDGSSPLLMVLLMIVFYVWAKVDKHRREKEISSLYTINDDEPVSQDKKIIKDLDRLEMDYKNNPDKIFDLKDYPNLTYADLVKHFGKDEVNLIKG